MGLSKKVAKANIYFTSSRIISFVLGFAFSIILARFLQPTLFGLYSFAFVILTFFVIFTDLGLNSTQMRFIAHFIGKGEREKALMITKLIFRYKITATLIVGFFITIFSDWISVFIFNKPEAGIVVLISGFLVIFKSVLDYFTGHFTGLKDFWFVSLMEVIQKISKFILAIGLVVFGFSVFGALVGVMLSFILVIITSFFYAKKKHTLVRFSGPKEAIDIRGIWSFSLWVFVGSIMGTLLGVADKLMISVMLNIENIGFYQIAFTWSSGIIFLVPITHYVLYPFFSGSENKNQLNSLITNSLKYASMFIFPLAFLLSVYSHSLILFLYNQSFLLSASALQILAFSSIFSVLAGLLARFFESIKRPDIVTKITSVILVLNIILNYFLIQSFGIAGASIATLLSSFIGTLLLFSVAFRKNIKFNPTIILKPLVSSIIVYFISLQFLQFLSNLFWLVIFGVISVFMYTILMFLIKGVTRKDVNFIISVFTRKH